MDLIEFARTGVNDKSGNPYRRYYCKKYGCYWSHKKKTPNGRMEKARKIREYKEQLSCKVCGYSHKSRGKKFTTWALQFHHHDSKKEANVGDMISDGFALSKIFKEIKKCIVLCANCHMELHAYKNY
jgi:hypothetical protein